jgi:hypothetical protein
VFKIKQFEEWTALLSFNVVICLPDVFMVEQSKEWTALRFFELLFLFACLIQDGRMLLSKPILYRVVEEEKKKKNKKKKKKKKTSPPTTTTT